MSLYPSIMALQYNRCLIWPVTIASVSSVSVVFSKYSGNQLPSNVIFPVASAPSGFNVYASRLLGRKSAANQCKLQENDESFSMSLLLYVHSPAASAISVIVLLIQNGSSERVDLLQRAATPKELSKMQHGREFSSDTYSRSLRWFDRSRSCLSSWCAEN